MSRVSQRNVELRLRPYSATDLTNLTISASTYISGSCASVLTTSYTRFSWPASTSGYVYYIYNIPSIPSSATINNVSCHYKSRRVSTSTGTTIISFASFRGNNKISESVTPTSTLIGTNDFFNCGSGWTPQNIQNFKLRFQCAGGSNDATRVVDVFGTTLQIDYTYNETEYEITKTDYSASGDFEDSGTSYSWVGERNDNVIIIDDDDWDSIVCTDESPGVCQYVNSSSTFSFAHNATRSITITSPVTNLISQGFDSYSQNTMVFPCSWNSFGCATANSSYNTLEYVSYGFDFPIIPSSCTIDSLSLVATVRINQTGQTSNRHISLCVGDQVLDYIDYNGSLYNRTVTVNSPNITAQDIPDINFRVYYQRITSTRYVYIHGASLSITYHTNTPNYSFKLYDENSDHNLVLTGVPRLKDNGSWVKHHILWKKINGNWVRQYDMSSPGIFSASTLYTRGEYIYTPSQTNV